MKLTEALELQKQLKYQRSRLSELIPHCCRAQEGLEPPFDANKLFQEYEELEKEIIDLSIRIQSTNNVIKFTYLNNDSPKSMTQGLADMDALCTQLSVAGNIVLSGIITRKWRTKIPDVAYADVVKYDKIRNELRLKRSALKLSIHKANMEFDLI